MDLRDRFQRPLDQRAEDVIKSLGWCLSPPHDNRLKSVAGWASHYFPKKEICKSPGLQKVGLGLSRKQPGRERQRYGSFGARVAFQKP
jgi:hypothetical protein